MNGRVRYTVNTQQERQPWPTSDGSEQPVRYMWVAGLVALSGVLLQCWIAVEKGEKMGWSPGQSLLLVLSYFTILTNILVTLSYLIPVAVPRSRMAAFFSRPSTRSALLLQVGMSGLIFCLLLERTWKHQGLQQAADILLHYITPALYMIFWRRTVPGSLIPWKSAAIWLIYPVAYLFYYSLFGWATHRYFYPFLNYNKVSLVQITGTILLLTLVFYLGGLLLIWMAKTRTQRESERRQKE